MSALGNPEDVVEHLLKHFATKELALEHAQWALDNVQKASTIAFWQQVINALNKIN